MLSASILLCVGWRTRSRKLINREDYLGGWRLAVMRVVDPVEWYMRRHDGENARPSRVPKGRSKVGLTMYSPTGEQPSSEIPERILEQMAREREEAQQVKKAVSREYGSLLEAKARELWDRNEVTITGAAGEMHAKLVRFRNGAVFEHRGASGEGAGHGMTRIDRSQLAHPIPMLAAYLENAVFDLGRDPRPLS